MRSVRAPSPLSREEVLARLAPEHLAPVLETVGITGIDRTELLAAAPRLLADPEIVGRIHERALALGAEAGLETPVVDLPGVADADNALSARVAPGRGLIAILAHLAATDTVRAWHAARGMSAEQSWLALTDLGQQMRVHRLTYGELGLHTVGWTALAWAGRLFSLGRLQYDLSLTDAADPLGRRWVIGVHIPATGPLDPEAVDASLDEATDFFTEHFADLAAESPAGAPDFGHEFRCSSWLVNAALPELVGAESNLARFSDRWRIRSTAPGANDAAFFVFHARPPYDPRTFERRTRLQRAVADALISGRGWDLGHGELVR